MLLSIGTSVDVEGRCWAILGDIVTGVTDEQGCCDVGMDLRMLMEHPLGREDCETTRESTHLRVLVMGTTIAMVDGLDAPVVTIIGSVMWLASACICTVVDVIVLLELVDVWRYCRAAGIARRGSVNVSG